MCVTCRSMQPPLRLQLPSAVRHPVYGPSGGSTDHVLRVRAAGRCRNLGWPGMGCSSWTAYQKSDSSDPINTPTRLRAVKIEGSRNFLETTIAADFSWALIQTRSSARFLDFLHLDQPGKRVPFFKMHEKRFFRILPSNESRISKVSINHNC